VTLSPGLLAAGLLTITAFAQTPENLVVEGVPPFPPKLREEVAPYFTARRARFQSWHPERRELLITTRFTPQLHVVNAPGGTAKQITFVSEPVARGQFRPVHGDCLVLSHDIGGGEFYQLYRLDIADGHMTLLTDGKSRNMGAIWSPKGNWLAYTSTKRTGKDNDVWIVNPLQPSSARLLHEVSGGGWRVEAWSHDESKLLLTEEISVNESRLFLLDVESGRRTEVTAANEKSVSYVQGDFSDGDKTLFVTTDRESEYQRLVEMDFSGRIVRVLTEQLKWDVEEFDLSSDAKTIAFVTNEDGSGVLRFCEAKSGKALKGPTLPMGIPSGLQWHENGRDLGFNFITAKSPNDAWSVDFATLAVTRWTKSSPGGIDPEGFVEPELVKSKSFDGLQISAFAYRPDPRKFPGQRPVIVDIHGGPEGQSRPGFQGRGNFYINEMGIAIIYPNVRGSTGFGKTFVALDDGFKREDSVRDLAAVFDFIKKDPNLDASRIAVAGGSYGGYMSLASMVHYADQVRCGIDVVGISNFLTFLKDTQDYRRDLRRVEYGDERDPKMAEFLERISPTRNARKIKKPLFVVQGKNDPRVPLSESEQMVKAIRDQGGTVWYLMAKDEGHGFAKKRNADFQFLATIQFYREFLLNDPPAIGSSTGGEAPLP